MDILFYFILFLYYNVLFGVLSAVLLVLWKEVVEPFFIVRNKDPFKGFNYVVDGYSLLFLYFIGMVSLWWLPVLFVYHLIVSLLVRSNKVFRFFDFYSLGLIAGLFVSLMVILFRPVYDSFIALLLPKKHSEFVREKLKEKGWKFKGRLIPGREYVIRKKGREVGMEFIEELVVLSFELKQKPTTGFVKKMDKKAQDFLVFIGDKVDPSEQTGYVCFMGRHFCVLHLFYMDLGKGLGFIEGVL